MLLAASEAVGPQLVASLLHKRAAAHKNPKVRCSKGFHVCTRLLCLCSLGLRAAGLGEQVTSIYACIGSICALQRCPKRH
jgi:hypothetical protein